MYAPLNIFLNLNINKRFINRQTVFEVLANNSNVIDRRYAVIGWDLRSTDAILFQTAHFRGTNGGGYIKVT